jgi:short subunit dehydrogenase-like uncharacterized protein
MKQTKQILIYGATGYTGKLTARTAKEKGLSPVLAGRNEAKVKAVADPLGFQYRAFDLSERAKLDTALSEVDVVLHIAGPFSATSRPMADACLRTGTHYLDITGEIDVFEALAARDAEAKSKGVMLLPGVGFDVVPSDCLAAHMKRRLPDAIDLKMYIGGLGHVSRGTAKTMVEGIDKGTRVRRDGKFVTMARANQDTVDFGSGPKATLGVSWGDVSTAYYSTQIPNIEVHFESMPQMAAAQRMPSFVKSIMGWPFVQGLLKAQIDRMPEGPTDAQRREGHAILIGVATNAKGERARTRLTTREGYTLTADTGLEIARRVVAGEFKPGFQTPSLAYGADFVLGFDGVRREELNA